MNKEIKGKWLAALESGEYDKGRFMLRSIDDKYCCLGVLCDLYAKEHDGEKWEIQDDNSDVFLFIEDEDNDIFVFQGQSELLPHAVADWAGLDSRSPVIGGVLLTEINDENDTFDSVIELIKEL